MRHEIELQSASGQPLAEIVDYGALIAALRARALERRIALGSAAAAEISGLPERYIPKLLSGKGVRRLGIASMGPVLGLLGVKLLLVEDPQAMALYDHRTPKMLAKDIRPNVAVTRTISKRFFREIGRKGAEKTNRVLADKRTRRERWRVNKDNWRAKQRAAARAHAAIAAPVDGVNA